MAINKINHTTVLLKTLGPNCAQVHTRQLEEMVARTSEGLTGITFKLLKFNQATFSLVLNAGKD